MPLLSYLKLKSKINTLVYSLRRSEARAIQTISKQFTMYNKELLTVDKPIFSPIEIGTVQITKVSIDCRLVKIESRINLPIEFLIKVISSEDKEEFVRYIKGLNKK